MYPASGAYYPPLSFPTASAGAAPTAGWPGAPAAGGLGSPAPTGSTASSTAPAYTPEQLHTMMLQYQLQQTQAHAQAQAQLLAMYQQQQQQQQLQSAAAAYHHALMQSARNQAAGSYGLNPAAFAAAFPAFAGMPTPSPGPQAQQQPQLPQAVMSGGNPPTPPPAATPLGVHVARDAMQQGPPVSDAGKTSPPPGAALNLTVGGAPVSIATPGAAPTDARIHAALAGTDVDWLPLPPRYVMDSVAKTAAAAKLATLRTASAAAVSGPADATTAATAPTEEGGVPKPPAKTVFVGGISFDVARDPRVIPWLAASAPAKRPVVVRKVIPHKERRARTDVIAAPPGKATDAATAPKLALSAFAVVDADDVDGLVEALHHRVLWDIGGCWIARTDAAAEALRNYANAHCTWQRREQGAAAGLPRHLMTVEPATAVSSATHASSTGKTLAAGTTSGTGVNAVTVGVPKPTGTTNAVTVGADNARTRGARAQAVPNFGDSVDPASSGAPPAGRGASVPLLPSVFLARARGAEDSSSSSADGGRSSQEAHRKSSDSPATTEPHSASAATGAFRLDWGALHGSYGTAAAQKGVTGGADDSDRSSGRRSANSSQGAIGER